MFQSLLAHMEWADALMWSVVADLPAAHAERPLLERLYHIHVVQWAYLQVWRGEALSVPEVSSMADLGAVERWARGYYPQAHAFVNATSGSAFAAELKVPWNEEIVKRYGTAAPATLGESVLQVVMHTTYHRGQVAARVRELGGEPPLTDYIAWIWKGRPAADWRS